MATTKKSKHGHVTGIDAKVARNINRSIVLNTIRRRQPISRAGISTITQLNKSTVSSIVEGLLEEDLLVELPDRGGKVGRNPVNLTVRHGKHFVGAIALDSPCTRLAIIDIDGTIRGRDEIWTKAVSPQLLMPQCIARLDALRATLGPHKFHGIGVSVAGIVDSAKSTVIYAANLGWSQVDLGSVIREIAPKVESVTVENDAKSSALAELLLGKHTVGTPDLIYLLLGAGIGAGITVNGRILGGTSHAAGEVGHMTVVDGGEPCQCGNKGCWELYASERAPVRWFANAKYPKGAPSTLTLPDVVDAARAGDADALHALQLWGQHIGVGIGDMIAILDPEVVIVGGAVTQIWDMIGEEINTSARGRGAFTKARATQILPTSLPDSPALLGAAALSIRKVFADFRIAL
ncbi:MAG TPA: ROK family protein [Bacteroidota bacterium]|nr:ROK family protein [Bacteroidota bacterium]